MTGTPYRLLSLPPDLVGSFHSITDLNAPEWYCTSDPAGVKVGSGGGTAWLVDSWLKDTRGVDMSDPKIIIHAGGQSRRLPAYACLLYTSPSPRDVEESRMPACG